MDIVRYILSRPLTIYIDVQILSERYRQYELKSSNNIYICKNIHTYRYIYTRILTYVHICQQPHTITKGNQELREVQFKNCHIWSCRPLITSTRCLTEGHEFTLELWQCNKCDTKHIYYDSILIEVIDIQNW